MNVDALYQLGVIVVQGNEQDVKAILQLIDDLERIGRESEVTVVMVPLEKGDATEIVYMLNQLFSPRGHRPQRHQRDPAAAADGPGRPRVAGRRCGRPRANLQAHLGRAAGPAALQRDPGRGTPKLRVNDVIDADQALRPRHHRRRCTPRPSDAAPLGVEGRPDDRELLEHALDRRDGRTSTRCASPGTTAANTIYVQAAPADMKEISELIIDMDTSEAGTGQ